MADDGGSVGVEPVAVADVAAVVVAEVVAKVVAELVADGEAVVPGLVDEPELVECDGVDGGVLVDGDEVVLGGGCE